MFFSKNQQQKDKKVRFQNPLFKRKLQEARGYRRPRKKIPESKVEFFLARLGLGGKWPKIGAFLALLATMYLLYAPNFFTIKNFEIVGAGNAEKANISQSLNDYFASKPLWPQNNLLLLSKNALAHYLLSKNRQVNKVIKITKHFPATLRLEVKPWTDKFLIKNGDNIYAVSNDGVVSKQLDLEDMSASSSPYASLLTINLRQAGTFYERQRLSDAGYFENLNEILNLAQNLLQKPVTEIEVENFERPDIEARLRPGFIVKFDLDSELTRVFAQLRLLLGEIGENRINGVKYIDMRIKDKSYVCYKDALCAQEVTPAKATSTPSAGPTRRK